MVMTWPPAIVPKHFTVLVSLRGWCNMTPAPIAATLLKISTITRTLMPYWGATKKSLIVRSRSISTVCWLSPVRMWSWLRKCRWKLNCVHGRPTFESNIVLKLRSESVPLSVLPYKQHVSQTLYLRIQDHRLCITIYFLLLMIHVYIYYNQTILQLCRNMGSLLWHPLSWLVLYHLLASSAWIVSSVGVVTILR